MESWFPDIESRNRALESKANAVKWAARSVANRFPRHVGESDDIEQFAWMVLIKAIGVWRPERGNWSTYADQYLRHLAAHWFRQRQFQYSLRTESLDGMVDHEYFDTPRFQVADVAQVKVFRKIEFPVSPERRKRQQREAMRRARGLSTEKARALESRFLVAA